MLVTTGSERVNLHCVLIIHMFCYAMNKLTYNENRKIKAIIKLTMNATL